MTTWPEQTSVIARQPAARRAWYVSIEALVFALTGFICSFTVADPDLWGHLRFGLDTLAGQGVVRADTYSYLSAGQPWINHEWLSEAVMAAAWRWGGAPALVGVKVAVVWATVAVVLAHLKWRGLSPPAAGLIVIAGWWLMLPWTTAMRPQVFTYLGCALVFAMTARAADGHDRVLWWSVPLMAVWANLHGGFLAGLALFGVWVAADVGAMAVETGWRSGSTARAIRRGAVPWLAAAAATLLTPYGVSLWTFLRTAFEPRAEISEWNPIAVGSIEGIAHAVLLIPAVAGWLASRRAKPAPATALFVCALAAPFVARRHTPIFALGLMMLAGEHLTDSVGRWLRRRMPADDVGVTRWPAVAFGSAALVFAIASAPHFTRIVVRPWEMPIAPVRWVKASGVSGNMITFFDWGEYAIWQLAPAVRVSMDGRRETVYSRAIYDEDERLLFGVGRWDALLRRGAPPPSLVLMSRRFAADNLLRLSPAWRVAYEDSECTLFVRAGSRQADALAATPRPDPIPDDADVAFP